MLGLEYRQSSATSVYYCPHFFEILASSRQTCYLGITFCEFCAINLCTYLALRFAVWHLAIYRLQPPELISILNSDQKLRVRKSKERIWLGALCSSCGPFTTYMPQARSPIGVILTTGSGGNIVDLVRKPWFCFCLSPAGNLEKCKLTLTDPLLPHSTISSVIEIGRRLSVEHIFIG